MSKLKGRVALVTGASKGIGAGIAKELAAAGAAVVVNYATDRAGADAVVQEITGADGRAVAIQGDVSKSGDVSRLFAEVKKAFGSLDVLVNNAGVYKIDAIGGDDRGRVPPGIRHERTRPLAGDPGIAQVLRSKRRERDQHRLGRIANVSARLFDLRSQQERPGCDHGSAGQGAGPTKNPRQFPQSRRDAERRR